MQSCMAFQVVADAALRAAQDITAEVVAGLGDEGAGTDESSDTIKNKVRGDSLVNCCSCFF